MPRGWTARPHCTPRLSRGTSTLLGRYSSTTRTSAPRMPRDLPHYRLLWKEWTEGLTSYGYFWTATRTWTRATTSEKLHCITQPPTATSRLLSYCSSATRSATPRTTKDPPHYVAHRREQSLTLCGYCWTVVRTRMHATTAETPHCIRQRSTHSSRLLGCYSSITRRSTLGMTTDLPHYTLLRRKETLASCVRCWTVLRMHRCTTTAESLRLDRPATGTRNSRGLHGYYPKKWTGEMG